MLDETTLKQTREIQRRLLDALDTICKKHGLIYWLDFGTLLGAVRHKGFIPWDDDLDVSMPLKDYREFLRIAQHELPRDIFLQTSETDPTFRQSFTKLRDCHSTMIEHHETADWQRSHPYHKGIFIDIFPSVLYPKMPKLFRKVLMRTTVRSREKAVILKKNTVFNYCVYFFCKCIWLLLSPLNKVGFGMTPEDNGYMYVSPLTNLFPLKDIEFESKFYPAPHDPHGHLSQIYKNHMTPPSEDKRIPHAIRILPDTPCGHPRALHRQ